MILLERMIAIVTALISFIGSFLGINLNLIDKKVDKFDVSSYVISDAIQSKDALLSEDFDIVTNAILFGCATFDNEGNVIIEKQELETALSNLREAIGDRDVKITLNLLGPGGHTDSEVWEDQMEALSNEHNKAFTSGVLEENIIAVLDEYGFDGVHFDYEYPLSTKAWFYFNNFLVSLKLKLGDYTLGVAVSDWNVKLSTLALKCVDYIELMLYDLYDAEGRHATFETVTEKASKARLTGLPMEKVRFGLPVYSRPTDQAGYWYGYKDYYNQLDSDGWYYDANIDKRFWFNTPDVIEKKTNYAITEGYGGVMLWSYTYDLHSDNEMSLLGAVGKAIDNNY